MDSKLELKVIHAGHSEGYKHQYIELVSLFMVRLCYEKNLSFGCALLIVP
jgi:hypothetical protein